MLLDGVLGCWLGYDGLAGDAGTCGAAAAAAVFASGCVCGSGSRISALSPLPNAFLGICDKHSLASWM